MYISVGIVFHQDLYLRLVSPPKTQHGSVLTKACGPWRPVTEHKATMALAADNGPRGVVGAFVLIAPSPPDG